MSIRVNGERALLVGAFLSLLLGYPLTTGFQAKFNEDVGQNQRSAGATGLGATNTLFTATGLGFKPMAVEVINDGDHNVLLGVRWHKKGIAADTSAYYPTSPSGASFDIGGAPIESVWVSGAGISTTADTLYWTVAK